MVYRTRNALIRVLRRSVEQAVGGLLPTQSRHHVFSQVNRKTAMNAFNTILDLGKLVQPKELQSK